MKIWKLVSGIISMILFPLISLQSFAAGCAYSLAESSEGTTSTSMGFLVGALILAGGIVSVAAIKKAPGNGGIISLYLIAAGLAFANAGDSYKDLYFYGAWALVCATLDIIFYFVGGKKPEKATEILENLPKPTVLQQVANKCPKCGTETDGKFCPNCGTNLQAQKENVPLQ